MVLAGWFLGGLVAVLVVLSLGQAAMQMLSKRQVGQPAPPLAGLPAAGRALVYFYSPTCGPCRAMSPVLRSLAAEGRAVVLVDVTVQPESASAFGVMATPTTVCVENGTLRDVKVGAMTRAELVRALETA